MAMPQHMSVVYDAPMSDGDGASPLYMQQTLDPTVLPLYCNPVKLSTAIAHQRTSAIYDGRHCTRGLGAFSIPYEKSVTHV